MKLETLPAKACTSLKCVDLNIIPPSNGECYSLGELVLDDRVYLQEIKGFLPNLDHFSTKKLQFLDYQVYKHVAELGSYF